MNKYRGLLFASLVVGSGLAATPAHAQFGIGINLGTNGFGVEAKQSLSPSFDLRFGISGVRYSLDYEYDDVEYDIEQSLAIPAIMLDWRPMQGVFRMTLGAAYYNDVQNVEATPEPGWYYSIGNGAYTAAEIGALNGKVTWHNGAPYLGLGWDFLRRKKGLGFSIDIGAYYRGKPDVALAAIDPFSTPGLAADVAREAQDVEDDAWTFVPTVQLGMAFKF